MSTETQGSLLVLFGFLAGAAGVLVRANPDTRFIGNGVAVLSIGMVIVGVIMSIGGRKK